MRITGKARARIARARRGRPNLGRNTIQKRKVLCPLCEVPVRSLARTGVGDEVVMSNLDTYQVVMFEFDDGSAHQTVMCKECSTGMTDDDAEAVYMANLAEFEQIENNGGGEAPWHLYESREITKFFKE